MRHRHLGVDLRWFLGLALAGAFLLCCALVWWHLPPEIVLATILGSGAAAVLVVTPVMGVHVFVMLLYFEEAAHMAGGLTAMKAVGPLIMGAWILRLIVTRRAALRIDPFLISMFAFIGWCAMSLLYTTNADETLVRLTTFAQLGVMTMMVASVIDSPRRLRQILWAVVLWTAVAEIVGIINYSLGLTKVVTGPAENRNSFALFLDIAMLCAFLLQQQMKSKLARLAIMFGLIPLFLVGLALTLSRGGWISLLIGMVLVGYHISSERRFWPVVTLAAVLWVLVPFLPDAFWERAGTILPSVQQRSETFGQRVDLWELGLTMVQKHPVLGVGVGNFISVSSRYARGEMMASTNGAHNSYITVAAESGLVGLVLFLLIHAFALRSVIDAIRLGKTLGLTELRLCGVTVEMAIVVYAVMSLSGSLEGKKLLWVLFGMAMSLRSITERLKSRTVEPVTAGLPVPSVVTT